MLMASCRTRFFPPLELPPFVLLSMTVPTPPGQAFPSFPAPTSSRLFAYLQDKMSLLFPGSHHLISCP